MFTVQIRTTNEEATRGLAFGLKASHRSRLPLRIVRLGVSLLLLLAAPLGADEDADKPVQLSRTVQQLIGDPLVSEADRVELRIFHGQWGELNEEALTAAQKALLAEQRFALDDAALGGEAVPPLRRGWARRWRGEPEQALAAVEGMTGIEAALLRARSLLDLGRRAEAAAALGPEIARARAMVRQPGAAAAELVAMGQAMVLQARLEGRPASDYAVAMELFGQAVNDVDRLYWPAAVAEAELLLERDNPAEAVKAAAQALTLNPRSSTAWFTLGQAAINSFNFDRGDRCIRELRAINEQHLLADILASQSLLSQRQPRDAEAVIDAALARYPRQRELLALQATAAAMQYDETRTARLLEQFQQMAPGLALGQATVGQYLSFVRQYPDAERHLRAAVALEPAWATPRVELGLLLMQAGHEQAARAELKEAARLDPFNKRAVNQLELADHLATFKTIETDHFLIRYRDGIDEVLARDMPEVLERVYDEITAVFEHRPRRKTIIEIMPDERWFGVRITGIPEIWTIAASTGDVLAMTPPRPGPRQRGSFDWARVIRHEFVHTVTLDQTAYRIPHWFTEACAVSQEAGGRDYNTCQLLAAALAQDKLFSLTEINWAFVRPKGPMDRPLAYGQAHWMLEFMIHRWGHRAVVDLLRCFRQGLDSQQAIEQVTGLAPEPFMSGFKDWAGRQVHSWGLGPAPGTDDERLLAMLKAVAHGQSIAPAEVESMLKKYPGHPDLLRQAAEGAMASGDPEAAWQAVHRYAAARPVDPWSHKALVQLAPALGRTEEAVGSLAALDAHEQSTGAWAQQLAVIYRRRGDLDLAGEAIARALHREPYHGDYRELAAAIALQRGDMERALHHLQGLAILEPDRPIHYRRLAAILARMGRTDEAAEAQRKAEAATPSP